MNEFLLNWVLSLLAWIVQGIGWGTIIAMAAAGVLLLSLSAKAMKFFSQPHGMAVSAAIMLAGAIFAWWTWPVKGSPTPPSHAEAGTASTASQAGGVAAKRGTLAGSATAEVAAKKPALLAVIPPQPLPMVPVVAAPPFIVPTMPVVAIPHLPPVIVEKPVQAHHPVEHKPPPAASSTVSRSAPLGRQGGLFGPMPGNSLAGGGNRNGGRQLTPAQRQRQIWNQINNQAGRDLDRMMPRMGMGMGMGTGMHPMGGHMGGMHHSGGHR